MTRDRRKPPKKQCGQGYGHRPINGAMLDVRNGASFIGCTEKALRGMVERRLIPFKRLGGRVVFIRAHLENYLAALDGCSPEEAIANLRGRRQ